MVITWTSRDLGLKSLNMSSITSPRQRDNISVATLSISAALAIPPIKSCEKAHQIDFKSPTNESNKQ
jgi:hypothetical protein